MKVITSLILAIAFIYAEDNTVVNIVSPMQLMDAIKFDTYIEVVKIKESGALVDTRSARNTTLQIHSYTIVTINNNPYLVITYIKPRENIQTLAKDLFDLKRMEETISAEMIRYKQMLEGKINVKGDEKQKNESPNK